MGWVQLAQDNIQRRIFVKKVRNLLIPLKGGKFVDRSVFITFSGSYLVRMLSVWMDLVSGETLMGL